MFFYTCLPEDIAIEAMALSLIMEDKPWVLRRNPQIRHRYEALLDPLTDEEKGFNLGALYILRNPRLAKVFRACSEAERRVSGRNAETETIKQGEPQGSEEAEC